jgi:hypothetical protein
MPQNKNLSRRDALKTLAAATGAVALTSLPNKWATPVVEVGALPAHAQGSFTINLVSADFPGGDSNCRADDSLIEIIFTYNDPTGNVTTGTTSPTATNGTYDGSIIDVYIEMYPSRAGGPQQWPLNNLNITLSQNSNEYTGTITVLYCVPFGAMASPPYPETKDEDDTASGRFHLQNDIGLVSNSISIKKDNPKK